MFEELSQIVQQFGGQSVVANNAVPDEHNEAVMQEASSSIMAGLQQTMQNGGPEEVQNLMNSVQSGDGNHPAVQQISEGFAGNIMQKFGIDAGTAQSIGASLIPLVMNQIANGSSGANAGGGGFDIGGMLGSLMGGSGGAGNGDMMGKLSSLGSKFGLDKNGDGKTDMSDLMGMFGK